MLPLIVLSIAAISPALAAELQRRPLNITITDNSPMLIYSPGIPRPEENSTRSGLARDSWNVSFSNSKWSEWTPNRVGHGTSEHRVSTPNATVSLSFMGTGVRFLGHTEDNANVSLRLVQSTIPKGRASYDDGRGTVADLQLRWGRHTVQLTLHNGTMVLTGVEIRTEIETFQDSAEDTLTIDVPARNGDGISPLVPNLQGSNTPGGRPWHAHDVICTSDDPVYFPRIDTWDKDAWATMTVPQNASYFTFWGSMNEDHREYSIEVIPPVPQSPAGPQTFSGYSSWCTPDTLMYAGPLDPRERYRIRVINLVDGRMTDIKKATFWIANETSKSEAEAAAAAASSGSASASETATTATTATAYGAIITSASQLGQASLSPAAIAGIVLGVASFLSAVGAAALFLFRRRRDQEKSDADQYDLWVRCASKLTPRDESKRLVHRHSHSWDSGMALSRDSGWTDSSAGLSPGLTEPPVTPPARHPSTRQRQPYATHTPQSSIGLASMASIQEDSLVVMDTDAGAIAVLMPPTYDPEWATERSPPLSVTEEARRSEITRAEAHRTHVPSPMPSPQYIGSSERGPRESHAITLSQAPRGPRPPSGQVTQLLSEMWGAPLQRKGSTWKPVQSGSSVSSATTRSQRDQAVRGSLSASKATAQTNV